MAVPKPDNEKNSIAQTVSRYGSQLLSFIKGKVKTVEDAEDILQDVWQQFSNISDLQSIESVSGWLYFVAKNKITDLYRKKSSVALSDLEYESDDGEFSIKDILLMDPGDNAELKIFKDMFWEEMQIALDELPEKQSRVFIKNEMEDLTLQEIADEEGENLKTIISRKGYAVKHLRIKLKALYDELYN